MKRLIRIGSVAMATATVLALGLSSASAGPTTAPLAQAGPTSTVPPADAPAASQNAPLGQAGPQVSHQAQPESLFEPITPCRIVDTRAGGGIVTNNVPRTFYVTGTTGFAPQGGKSGGCGVPGVATGITTNITTAHTVSDGYLTGYPTGATPPNTNFITTHKNFTLTANPTFALAAGNAKPLTITNHGGNTDIIIDVTGFYLPQIHAVIDLAGTLLSATPRVLSATQTGTGSYSVVVDRNIDGCSVNTNAYGSGTYIANATAVGSTIQVDTYNTSGTGSRASINFELTAAC